MASASQPTTIDEKNGAGERSHDENQPPEEQASSGSLQVVMPEDGYEWKKYGQKHVKSIHKIRSYFKCREQGCSAKKKVEWHPRDPTHSMRIVYEGPHHHGPHLSATTDPPQADAVADPYDLTVQFFGSRSQ